MYGAGCGPGDAQSTGRAVGQVMHNVRGGLWARWCTMCGAGCRPGDAQCMGRAVGQVMHNVRGGLWAR